jgi:hypothetical protein
LFFTLFFRQERLLGITLSENGYLLLYQTFFGGLIAIIFARKKDLISTNTSFRSFFQNLFSQETISADRRSLAIIDETKKSYKDFMLDPEQEVKKIYSHLKTKDYNKVKDQVMVLEEFIKANKKELTPYCSLNVTKFDINELLNDAQKMIKALGIKNINIQNISNYQKISCDKTSILKALWKFCMDYLAFKAKNYDDDYYLGLLVKNIRISYKIGDKTLRTIDGVSFVLTDDGFIENGDIQDNYEVELPDPEKIHSVGIYDEELSDIQNIIAAHYGDTINLSTKQEFAYQIVIPKTVGEIRPVNLDLRAPIDTYYNWPEAEKLETNFWNKIKTNFPSLNQEKIKKAVEIIKIYHFHQSRKSGEPYYLHPMNVAMIAMDIIQDKNSKIHQELNENIEPIILASLLHDILEDTAMREVALNNIFGMKVVDYVKEVTKIDYKERTRVLSNKEAFTKLIEQHYIPVCIKLADRLHNLMTIDGHPKVEKRKAVAQETLDFFVPPAEKFGLEKLAQQLREGSRYVLEKGRIEGCKF